MGFVFSLPGEDRLSTGELINMEPLGVTLKDPDMLRDVPGHVGLGAGSTEAVGTDVVPEH
jgi:hypothetical protein